MDRELQEKLFDIRRKAIEAIISPETMSKLEILRSLGLLASAIDHITFYLEAQEAKVEEDSKNYSMLKLMMEDLATHHFFKAQFKKWEKKALEK